MWTVALPRPASIWWTTVMAALIGMAKARVEAERERWMPAAARVHADHLGRHVDQGSAGIPWPQRGIDLDQTAQLLGVGSSGVTRGD